MLQKINRKQLIISADDFGKSEQANRNILRLAEAGKLDRVSVMVEGDISEEESERLCAANVRLDIHFELVWQKRRRNLLKDHTVRQAVVFLVNYLWGDWPVPENPRSGAASVKREWEEQIEKFQKYFNRSPDGISSHEHVHFFPAYFKIAVALAKKYEIPFIRFGKKGFWGEKNSVYVILNIMRRMDKKNYFRSGLSSSNFFASLDWIENFENFLKNMPKGSMEIACHPEREGEFELIEKFK